MKQYFVKCGIAMALSVLFMAPSIAGADVFMREKHHTDGMTVMGHAQPPRDTIQTTWVTQDKLRNDQGDTSSIVIMVNDNIVVYHLNHAQKTYTELSMASDEFKQAASGMAGEFKVKVTATGETRKIGNWNCRKYLKEMDMGMMPAATEIWASEDIKMPYQNLYERFSTAMMAQQPGMQMSMQAIQEEVKKIKGVPVLTITTTTIMKDTTVRSSHELVEIKEGQAPAGIFEIPPEYTKQSMSQGMRERKMPGRQKPK